ncbi:MAG: DUF368 domain-containing protein [Oscillospiraceae bacterium]|nr:DUF368 domain-containing protein [Oscillospiraceae bacterium]
MTDGMPIGKWLLLIVKGMLIGAGAILPGISGGVLMLVFGIYQPVIAFLAHPVRTFRTYVALFIPLVIGWALGFWLIARLLSDVFARWELQAMCVFIGLILGMFPELFRQSSLHGRTKGSWLGLALCTAGFLALFFYLQVVAQIALTPNVLWFAFCGVLWGLSLIVPGLTSSSLLMFLGLYVPMTEGLGSMDPAVVIPWIIGIAATVLLLAKVVERLFRRHYSVAFHCIIGVVIASTIPIIPVHFAGVGQGLFCLLLAVIGFLIAWGMDRWGRRWEAEKNE